MCIVFYHLKLWYWWMSTNTSTSCLCEAHLGLSQLAIHVHTYSCMQTLHVALILRTSVYCRALNSKILCFGQDVAITVAFLSKKNFTLIAPATNCKSRNIPGWNLGYITSCLYGTALQNKSYLQYQAVVIHTYCPYSLYDWIDTSL